MYELCDARGKEQQVCVGTRVGLKVNGSEGGDRV